MIHKINRCPLVRRSSNDASAKYYSRVKYIIHPTHIRSPLEFKWFASNRKTKHKNFWSTQNYTVNIYVHKFLWCAQITITSSINRFQFNFPTTTYVMNEQFESTKIQNAKQINRENQISECNNIMKCTEIWLYLCTPKADWIAWL